MTQLQLAIPYTIALLLLGFIMINFRKLFGKSEPDRSSITEIEKELIQTIHDDNLNKFKVIFEEQKLSPDKVCFVSLPQSF